LNFHLFDNPPRPPLVIGEKARFQFEYLRLRLRGRTGKTNESRAISRDLLRAIISRLPVVTWLENYMPYRDRAAAARCYGRYYKRPDDKIGDRGVRAGAGVPILTPVRSSRDWNHVMGSRGLGSGVGNKIAIRRTVPF